MSRDMFGRSRMSDVNPQDLKGNHNRDKKVFHPGTIRRLLQYLMHYRWMLLTAIVFAIASNILALIGPMLSGWAIDAIEPGRGAVQFEKVFRYCGWMAAFYVLSAALSYANSVLMIRLSQRVTYRMRRDVFEHLLELPVSYFDKLQAGDIISRISYDIDTINASLSNDVITVCTTFITVIGSLISMLMLSPVLLLVFAVTLPLTILFTRARATKVRPLFRRRSAMLGQLNGYAEEILSGQKSVKAYCQEQEMVRRFDERNEATVDANFHAEYTGGTIGPCVNFINNLSLCLISTGGALMYLMGYISLGAVGAFVQYSRKFSGPIGELANIASELQSAMAAADRIFNLLDQPPEPADAPDARQIQDSRGSVKLQHVTFGYVPEREVLRDLSVQVQAGQRIAIVGPTGAGKTTLVNLLMRFYDPQGGCITLDGCDIREITRGSLRRQYTMVLQDTWLFHGTIAENIAYGREGASREEIVRAAQMAHVHDFIQGLPQGYDTVLTDDGASLSKGQKQLLTIARAMLADAPMLILDEATSNVDTRTERMIQDAMYALMEGRTCFIIAHRLSTIQNADCILVVRDGDIVEQGNHQQLMERGGFYARLYNAQFAS